MVCCKPGSSAPNNVATAAAVADASGGSADTRKADSDSDGDAYSDAVQDTEMENTPAAAGGASKDSADGAAGAAKQTYNI